MALLSALGHLANLGQLVDIGQGQAHHREQIWWTRRNYALDAQALKIDLLGAARDDVRGTYDTYIERLDTLLLLNALLLPFALNTLQFSDEFVPKTENDADCNDCIEARHPWLGYVWVYLVAACLILPFWALLLLLRCKMDLDRWLQHTLDSLQALRRDMIAPSRVSAEVVATAAGRRGAEAARQKQEELAEEQEHVVAQLGSFIVEYQDMFTEVWGGHCAPMVFWATRLLWMSACLAIALTGHMFTIFLANRRGEQREAADHFFVLFCAGLGLPVVVYAWSRCRSPWPAPPQSERSDPTNVTDALMRTLSSRSFQHPPPFCGNSPSSSAGSTNGFSNGSAAQPFIRRSASLPAARPTAGRELSRFSNNTPLREEPEHGTGGQDSWSSQA
mmetsp:Transcript_8401/g.18244  ORF Transcript_8401/g.18244 Transcript_8401/m.18244 type:complete len:390 (+) Transcript_8401:171-1340(+)|eukprot:CAMPEP_0206430768 /NCGR_PEP_ID=MMETSP0324_2-20121206/6999_1 /ASSEMBLY_ACC=CAM_ASM_000836 /TAXON_ID=2866 /ORGANISM="Crypthecodinium cohnii, Strain Seligo" /LENGTH=389 /DNA_ID=CAMNT_0053896635 /DNA_START=84 /DNA_END=1253 /DNA_ORIENTATION=-